MKRLNYDPKICEYTWNKKESPRKKVVKTVKHMNTQGGRLKDLIMSLQDNLERKSEIEYRSKSINPKLYRKRN